MKTITILLSVVCMLTLTPAGHAEKEKHGGGQLPGGVMEALKWLARHQNEDGSWGVKGFANRCGKAGYSGACAPNRFAGDEQYDVGVTGLSLLAFISAGFHQGSVERYDNIPFGEVVKKGFKWLTDHQDAEGCLASRRGQYMYNHLIATLALCEAYALTDNAIYKAPAQKAIDFTVAAQNPGSGWRYCAKGGDSDSSVTGWAVMALKSAELAKLNCPKGSYDGAKAWYDGVTLPDGGIGYISKVRGKVSIRGVNDQYDNHETMTAIATVTRLLAGQNRRDPVVQSAISLISADAPSWKENKIDYYYWYYGSLAMTQYDGPNGAEWKKWSAAVKGALAENQNRENGGDKCGSWEPVDRWSCNGGRVYATAINCLTLLIASR